MSGVRLFRLFVWCTPPFAMYTKLIHVDLFACVSCYMGLFARGMAVSGQYFPAQCTTHTNLVKEDTGSFVQEAVVGLPVVWGLYVRSTRTH